MNNSVDSMWNQLMTMPEARWIIWITCLAISILVAVYVVTLFRNMAIGTTEISEDPLMEFRRLRDEGKMDDKEFASVKSVMLENKSDGADLKGESVERVVSDSV